MSTGDPLVNGRTDRQLRSTTPYVRASPNIAKQVLQVACLPSKAVEQFGGTGGKTSIAASGKCSRVAGRRQEPAVETHRNGHVETCAAFCGR